MTEHLDTISLARYLGGAANSAERARWESHLADCPDCREELVEAHRIVTAAPGRRRSALVPLAAAAAVLLVVWSGTIGREQLGYVTRDPHSSSTLALAPRPVAPLGAVSGADRLLWNRVANATRYRVTLFTGDGRSVWQTTTPDTLAALPGTIHLATAVPYYWQVKAEIGFGRWVESELVAFTLTRTDIPR
jgi:hypothetical protein